MKAIIEVDVPEYQIGQEVSIYFKDTMMVKGIVQEPTPNDDYFRRMAGVVISQLRTDRDRLEDELAKREQEPSGDLIRRQAVLDGLKGCICEEWIKTLFATMVKQLPSVNPQEPKTGHWIEKDGFDGDVYYDCSECGESWTTIEGTPWDNEWNYCPNCGCRMVEPQESEDKE